MESDLRHLTHKWKLLGILWAHWVRSPSYLEQKQKPNAQEGWCRERDQCKWVSLGYCPAH